MASNNIQTRAKSLRQSLAPANENAIGTSTRLRNNMKPVSTQVAEKPLAKGLKGRVQGQRAALGDLSNKQNVNNVNSSKISKIKPTRTQVTSGGRKRSISNPVIERAKVDVVVKNAQETSVVTLSHVQPATEKETPLVEAKSQTVKMDEELVYWEDLDASDNDDPLMVSEYVVEIFEYMRVLEKDTLADANYMDKQDDITWHMRTILVDWMIEIHDKFKLLPESLFLAINIMDRFLSQRVVSIVKLQLVGLTSLFIAVKYEEVTYPSVKQLIFLAENGYTIDEVYKSERYILQVLNFGLHYPNPMNFLRRISKAEGYDLHTRTLAKFLIEITLMSEDFLSETPSKIAAAGAYLSRQMLNRTNVWVMHSIPFDDSETLRYYSGGYKEHEVLTVVEKIKTLLENQTKFSAIHKKYSAKKFMKASLFVQQWMKNKKKDVDDKNEDDCDE